MKIDEFDIALYDQGTRIRIKRVRTHPQLETTKDVVEIDHMGAQHPFPFLTFDQVRAVADIVALIERYQNERSSSNAG